MVDILQTLPQSAAPEPGDGQDTGGSTGPERAPVGRIISGVVVTAIAGLLCGAVAVYLYGEAPFLLWLACVAQVLWMLLLLVAPLALSFRTGLLRRLAIKAIVAFPLVLLFDSHVLHLAEVWDVALGEGTRRLFCFPLTAVSASLNLAQGLAGGLPIPVRLPPIDGAVASSAAGGSVFVWFAEFIWEIVISVLGSIVFALTWGRRA